MVAMVAMSVWTWLISMEEGSICTTAMTAPAEGFGMAEMKGKCVAWHAWQSMPQRANCN